jgi:DNA-binding FadR family transcriptional regulator
MDALKPVSRTTLSEQVAMQLASELTGGRWKPGEKLPSEAELCKAFNVGRSTLREALKSLAFIGLIRMRAGGGSYVSEQPSKYLDGPLFAKGVLNTEKDITDLSDARILLETEVAGLCAQRATDQDLAALHDILKQMKTAIEQGGDALPAIGSRLPPGDCHGQQEPGLVRDVKAHSRGLAGVDYQKPAVARRHGHGIQAAPRNLRGAETAQSGPGAQGDAQSSAGFPARLQSPVPHAAAVKPRPFQRRILL